MRACELEGGSGPVRGMMPTPLDLVMSRLGLRGRAEQEDQEAAFEKQVGRRLQERRQDTHTHTNNVMSCPNSH